MDSGILIFDKLHKYEHEKASGSTFNNATAAKITGLKVSEDQYCGDKDKMHDDHYDYRVSSTVTVHAEVGNFKLSVDKIENAELLLRVYYRLKENMEWVEILPESASKSS